MRSFMKKVGGFARNKSHILIEGENMAIYLKRAKPWIYFIITIGKEIFLFNLNFLFLC